MNINFPPKDEQFIKSMVEQGYYSNATEVVRDAVRRLRDTNSSILEPSEQLRALIEAAQENFREGNVVPYTEDFFDKAMERARHNASTGKEISAHVQPRA